MMTHRDDFFPSLPSLASSLSTRSALRTSTYGNKELSAGNYTDWPGLVETINDKSRVFQVWVNGNESFSFSGDTDSINRLLQNFAKTKVPQLNVILKPGPGPKLEHEGKNHNVDVELQVVGGIGAGIHHREGPRCRLAYRPNNDDLRDRPHRPQQTVHSRPDSSAATEDLRKRYQQAEKAGSAEVRTEAIRFLNDLNKEFEGEDSKARREAIKRFIIKRSHQIA